MFVKICGVCNSVDAAAVSRSTADAVGFVMGGSVLPVEIEPRAQDVRAIIKTLRPALQSVLVTHLQEPAEILALADYIGCSAIQVSEPLASAQVAEVRRNTGRLLIKTVSVEPGAEQYLRAVEEYCDYVLLDTRSAGYVGGTGKTSDWRLCAELVALAEKPVLLAGGLTPDNVGAGIAATKPAGVDVSTGISCFCSEFQRKDRKDERKILSFIERARRAEAELCLR